jgi:hypothetical protein
MNNTLSREVTGMAWYHMVQQSREWKKERVNSLQLKGLSIKMGQCTSIDQHLVMRYGTCACHRIALLR